MHSVPAPADIRIAPTPSGSQVGGGVASVLAAAAAVAPLAVIALAGPRFMELFRDFGVAIPLVTRAVIDLGDALASPLGVALMLLIGAGVAGLVFRAWRSRWGLGMAALLACIGWLCVSLGIIAVSLFVPTLAVVQAIEQSGKP